MNKKFSNSYFNLKYAFVLLNAVEIGWYVALMANLKSHKVKKIFIYGESLKLLWLFHYIIMYDLYIGNIMYAYYMYTI